MNGLVPSTWSGPLMSLLRIVSALLFIMHGTSKLFAWPGTEGQVPVALMSMWAAAGPGTWAIDKPHAVPPRASTPHS